MSGGPGAKTILNFDSIEPFYVVDHLNIFFLVFDIFYKLKYRITPTEPLKRLRPTLPA